MRGQGTRSVSQWDFSTGQEMSVTAKNPHERYVRRKVRKAFRIRRKVRGKATTVWQSFEGVVRVYDAKLAVFDKLYEDKDEEEVDFLAHLHTLLARVFTP